MQKIYICLGQLMSNKARVKTERKIGLCWNSCEDNSGASSNWFGLASVPVEYGVRGTPHWRSFCWRYRTCYSSLTSSSALFLQIEVFLSLRSLANNHLSSLGYQSYYKGILFSAYRGRNNVGINIVDPEKMKSNSVFFFKFNWLKRRKIKARSVSNGKLLMCEMLII